MGLLGIDKVLVESSLIGAGGTSSLLDLGLSRAGTVSGFSHCGIYIRLEETLENQFEAPRRE